MGAEGANFGRILDDRPAETPNISDLTILYELARLEGCGLSEALKSATSDDERLEIIDQFKAKYREANGDIPPDDN